MKRFTFARLQLSARRDGGAGNGAQTPAEFYKGKNVRMIIGAAVGGGYDLPGRMMQQHMSRHIPGNPPVSSRTCPAPPAS